MDQAVLDSGGIAVDFPAQYAGKVAEVTLRRPSKRNAQDPSMWAALDYARQQFGAEVAVVVLRGEGQSFSAGLDRRMLDPQGSDGESLFALLQREDQGIIDQIGIYQRGFTWLTDPRFLTIAVVQGHAVGAGFQLALGADLRIAHDDVSFCMKEAFYGLVPDLAGTKRLVELVGYAKALEIVATARTIDAAEAASLGLANYVLPAAEVEAKLAELISQLLAVLPNTVRASKALLAQAWRNDAPEQALAERTAQVGRFRELAALFAPQA